MKPAADRSTTFYVDVALTDFTRLHIQPKNRGEVIRGLVCAGWPAGLVIEHHIEIEIALGIPPSDEARAAA